MFTYIFRYLHACVRERICRPDLRRAYLQDGASLSSVSTMWIFDFLLEVQNFGGWKVSVWLVLSKTQALSHNRASLDKNTAHTHWCICCLRKGHALRDPHQGVGESIGSQRMDFSRLYLMCLFPLLAQWHPHCVPIVNHTCEYNHMLSTVSPCSEALNVPVILAPLTQQVSDRRTSRENLPKPPNGMTQTLRSYNHRFLGWILWPS